MQFKFLDRLQKHPRYLLILSLLSGALMAISWYPPFTLLIFIAFVPLLAIEQHVYDNFHLYKKPTLVFWKYAMLTLLIWNVGTVWWVWFAAAAAGVFAWVANSLLMSIPLVLFHKLKRLSNEKLGYLPLFVFWIAFEYLHHNWGGSWTWLSLGNIFAFFPQAVQWYEYTGIFGGTFWILLVNAQLFYTFFKEYTFYIPAAFIALPIGLSLLMYFNYEEKGKEVEVVVVQPNLDCYQEKFSRNPGTGAQNPTFVPYDDQVKRYFQLSEEKVTDKTAFVAFPETSMHNPIMEVQAMGDFATRQCAEFVKRHPNVSVVTGVDSYVIYPKDKKTPTSRLHIDSTYYDLFNAAMFVTNKDSVEFYHKSKLVIGVESNPLRGLFGFIGNTLMLDLGGIVGDLGTQEERAVFANDKGIKVAPVICYESVYGEFVGEYMQKGANLIFIITNDGWWYDTPGHRQHWAYARLRAIETRKSIARAANTGISGFINQRGDELQKSKYNEMVALRDTIKANDELTFYARMGDYLGRVSMYLSFFVLISAISTYVRNKYAARQYQVMSSEQSQVINEQSPVSRDN